MSYNDYLQAVDLIEKNKHLIDPYLYPQNEETIKHAEILLSIKFPRSYRDFLKRYGSLSLGASDIYGLDNIENYSEYRWNNIVCTALDERNFNYEDPFPLSFIPIYDLGNGEKFCLDTAKTNDEGECPMMAWYFGRIESLKDDTGKDHVGDDFGDFLLNFIVKPALETAKEKGKIVVL